jgi:hypothetical protein
MYELIGGDALLACARSAQMIEPANAVSPVPYCFSLSLFLELDNLINKVSLHPRLRIFLEAEDHWKIDLDRGQET